MAKSEPSVGGLRDEEVEGRDWERVRPRRVSDQDWGRFEGYISEILVAMGMPLDTCARCSIRRRATRATPSS